MEFLNHIPAESLTFLQLLGELNSNVQISAEANI